MSSHAVHHCLTSPASIKADYASSMCIFVAQFPTPYFLSPH